MLTRLKTQFSKTLQPQEQLLHRLKNFGLSPDDWHIERIGSKYLLTHLDSNDFQFVGYTTADRRNWISLHLYSL